MSKTSRRGLFRSPFFLDQSAKLARVSIQERENFLSEDDRTLANVETQKKPNLTLERPSNDSALINVETQKSPVLIPEPPRYKGPIVANAVAHYPVAQQNLPSTPGPFFTAYPDSTLVGPNSPQKKGKRAALSKRKKIQRAVIAGLLLLPSLIIIFELINGFIIYKQAEDGIAHLQAIQTIFHGSSSDGPGKYFDQNKLRQAEAELATAHANFVSLSSTLDNDGIIGLSSGIAPSQIRTVRALGHIAVDGTSVAQQLIKVALDIAPNVSVALKQNVNQADNVPLKPFINAASFQEISNTLGTIAPLVHAMSIDAQGLSLNALPISTKDRQLVTSILPLLPILDSSLAQKQQWINVVGWFLGVNSPRAFLIEPMDSSELRATGGFTGQFADLTLNGGHMGSLKFSNIGKYEESLQDSTPDPTVYPKVVGQTAPDPYSSWWPVANFGLRDANLSADFPTSAKIAMNRYTYEFGNHVDGAIIFTPTLIQQVLHVTGPIKITAYGETINEQNLEARLHYYQLDNKGIRREEIVEHVEDPQVARKLFTQRVTSALMSAVTHLPINKLLPMGNEMLQSMKSKDLQIYVTNPQLETLIGKYGSTAALDRSTTHDGLFIVQSNLSASKASQYVTTKIQDNVTLDKQGGATHNLQLTLDYQQKGDVYGFDTYRDYVRMYVPVNSQLLTGNGFDEYDKPYCGDAQSGYTLCQSDVYGDGSLVCSPPVEMGYATSYLNDPYTNRDHPLDVTGPPQNQQSDEQGRAMLGGWVVIPKNCTMKVTVSWYVPPMSKQPYSLLLQAQASVYSPLDLTIQSAAGTCVQQHGKSLHFAQVMDGEDLFFSVKHQGSDCSLVSQ